MFQSTLKSYRLAHGDAGKKPAIVKRLAFSRMPKSAMDGKDRQVV